jgi:hypothetical protein
MIYDVLSDSEHRLAFCTASRARRGRAVLYALGPWLTYLFIVSVMFAASQASLCPWQWTLRTIRFGIVSAFPLSAVGSFLGYRMRDQVEALPARIYIEHTPPLGRPRSTCLRISELKAFGVDPRLRSLGADLMLVAVRRDGQRIPLAEGDPHTGQLRHLAERAAQLTGLPLEPPRFSTVPPVGG